MTKTRQATLAEKGRKTTKNQGKEDSKKIATEAHQYHKLLEKRAKYKKSQTKTTLQRLARENSTAMEKVSPICSRKWHLEKLR